MDKSTIDDIAELRKLKMNIYELRKIYDKIKNEMIRENLKKIIITSDNIYKEVVLNSEKLYKIRKFNNYYIITIQKILNQYIILKENKIVSKEAKELCLRIENFIENVNNSLKKIYNSLFDTEIIDIDAEIKVMINELNIKG